MSTVLTTRGIFAAEFQKPLLDIDVINSLNPKKLILKSEGGRAGVAYDWDAATESFLQDLADDPAWSFDFSDGLIVATMAKGATHG